MVSEKQFDQLLSVLTRIAGALERPPGTRVPLEQALLAIHPRPEPPYADPISPDTPASPGPIRTLPITLPITLRSSPAPESGPPVSELGPNVSPVPADLYPPFSRSVNAPPSSSPPDGGAQPEPRKEDNRPTGDWR